MRPNPTDLEALLRPLRRAHGFALYVCTAPNRCAVAEAAARLRRLVEAAGRLDARFEDLGDLPPRAVIVHAVDAPDPGDRRRVLRALNLARDRFGKAGVTLIACILEVDVPLFAEAAPDLWSVRTRVVHNDIWPLPPVEIPEAFFEAADRVAPALLEATVPRPFADLLAEAGVDNVAERWEAFFVAPPLRPRTPTPHPPGALELLRRRGFARLVGEPGCGKSALVMQFARDLARHDQPVILTDLRRGDATCFGVSDLERTLRALRERCPWPSDEAAKPWLLVDGLDGLDAGERNRVVGVCADLITAKACRGVLLAARTFGDPAPVDIAVECLGPDEIDAFVTRWAEGLGRAPEAVKRSLLSLFDADEIATLPGFLTRPLYLALGVSAALEPAPARRVDRIDLALDLARRLITRRPSGHRSGATRDLEAIARRLAIARRATGMPAPAVLDGSMPSPDEVTRLRLETSVLLDADEPVFAHPMLEDGLYIAEALERTTEPSALIEWLLGPSHDASTTSTVIERLMRRDPERLRRALDHLLEVPSTLDVTLQAHALSALTGFLLRAPAPVTEGLDRIASRIRRALYTLNRDPDVVRRAPTVGVLTADALARQGDARLGGLEFVPVTPEWSLARWPLTGRDFWRFADAHAPTYARLSEAGQTRFHRVARHVDFDTARALVQWWRTFIDPAVRLPPSEIWSAAAAAAPDWLAAPAEPVERDHVGAAAHLAGLGGVEDLGGLVRQWLAPPAGGTICWAGYATGERAVPLRDTICRAPLGEAAPAVWFGVRLARYTPAGEAPDIQPLPRPATAR